MNSYIRIPKNKKRLSFLIFPDTFKESPEKYQVILKTTSPMINIGFINSNDIKIELTETTLIEFTPTIDGLMRISETHSHLSEESRFKVYKNSKQARDIYERSLDNELSDKELWEKVLHAGKNLLKYDYGKYDFIVVDSKWLIGQKKKAHFNVISFEDAKNILRAFNNHDENYVIDSRGENKLFFEEFYFFHSHLYFKNILKLKNILFGDFYSYAGEENNKDQTLDEIFWSIEKRMTNIIFSYDEMNYELFKANSSNKADYRIKSFWNECSDILDDYSKLINILFDLPLNNKKARNIFECRINFREPKFKKIFDKSNNLDNTKDFFYNSSNQNRYSFIKSFRNKTTHGDPIFVSKSSANNNLYQNDEIVIRHIDLKEDWIEEFKEDYNLYLKVQWYKQDDEIDFEKEKPDIYTLPLRETLDFIFDSIIVLVNGLTENIIEDYLLFNPVKIKVLDSNYYFVDYFSKMYLEFQKDFKGSFLFDYEF